MMNWLKKDVFEGGKYPPEEYTCYRNGALYMLLGIVISLVLLRWQMPAIQQFPIWLKIVIGMLPIQLLGGGGALLGTNGLQWYRIPDAPTFSFRLLVKKMMICFLLVTLCNGMMYAICYWLGLPFGQQTLVQLLSSHKTFPVILTIGLSAAVLAPLAEELMFRVVLYRWLQGICGGYAVVFTSLIFAICHGCWQFIPALFCIGCMLQHTCEHYGYARSVMLHGVFNLLGFLAIVCQ